MQNFYIVHSTVLATPPNLPTYTNGYTGSTSTIDLIFCSPQYFPLTNTLTLADLGSDHTPILSTIEITPEQQQLGKRSKWVFNNEAWDLWLRDLENYTEKGNLTIPEEAISFTQSLVETGENHFKKNKDTVTPKYNKVW